MFFVKKWKQETVTWPCTSEGPCLGHSFICCNPAGESQRNRNSALSWKCKYCSDRRVWLVQQVYLGLGRKYQSHLPSYSRPSLYKAQHWLLISSWCYVSYKQNFFCLSKPSFQPQWAIIHFCLWFKGKKDLVFTTQTFDWQVTKWCVTQFVKPLECKISIIRSGICPAWA